VLEISEEMTNDVIIILNYFRQLKGDFEKTNIRLVIIVNTETKFKALLEHKCEGRKVIKLNESCSDCKGWQVINRCFDHISN